MCSFLCANCVSRRLVLTRCHNDNCEGWMWSVTSETPTVTSVKAGKDLASWFTPGFVREVKWKTAGLSFTSSLQLVPWSFSLMAFWSTYSKIYGALIRIPTVPPIVTAKKIYNCKRSITMAMYLQSSKIWNTKNKLYNNAENVGITSPPGMTPFQTQRTTLKNSMACIIIFNNDQAFLKRMLQCSNED